VDLSSNGSLIIGAFGENDQLGSVYDYVLDAGTWIPESTLADPGAVDGDWFGYALSMNGTTLAVGAPGTEGTLSTGTDNEGEQGTGAVDLYSQTGGNFGTWSVPTMVVASNGEGCVQTCSYGVDSLGGDYFGYSVSLRGAVLAVGAPYASIPPEPDGFTTYAPTSTGTAYAFRGAGSAWTQKIELYDPAEVQAGSSAVQDYFGYVVTVTAKSSIVATAPYAPEGSDGNGTGIAFVFSKLGQSWSGEPTELTASDGAPGSYFGWEGLTSSGRKMVVVGAPYAPDGGIYFYKR
jgi:hypothetical protein